MRVSSAPWGHCAGAAVSPHSARLSDLAVPVSPYITGVYENRRVMVAKTPIFQYNWGMVPTSINTLPTAPSAAKSMLARLLATENIAVVHQNIPTAFFDLKTRALHLPLWSNASGSLYDMLVGHEVAHALFTPADGWKTAIDSVAAATGCDRDTAKQYLNIVEDARIERDLMRNAHDLNRSGYMVDKNPRDSNLVPADESKSMIL